MLINTVQAKKANYMIHIIRKLFLPYVNNKAADQPAHLRSLISAFFFRRLDSIKSLLAIADISRLWLVSSAEKVGLSLHWLQNRFSLDKAHIDSRNFKLLLST